AVVAALPAEVTASDDEVERLRRDGQIRLWWDTTPVDVFLNTDRFHEEVAARVRWEDFGGQRLPFLARTDLAVFKAFFDRTRDWADLEAMAEVGSLDLDRVVGVLVRRLAPAAHRIDRLRALDAIKPRDCPPVHQRLRHDLEVVLHANVQQDLQNEGE